MSKFNVIIDCDTGIDDSIALILALLSKDINVVGISVCGGNTTLYNAYLNTKRILKLLEKDVPVIKGCSKPFFRELETASETHGEDGFGEIGEWFDKTYSFSDTNEANEMSVENFYVDALNKYDDLILIAVGPMTNIYKVLKNRPEIFKRFKRFISMGGNYKSHGNCSPVAEYNYWVDPEAASYVFNHSPISIEMVGLDVTRKIVLEDTRMNSIINSNAFVGNFIKKITKFYYDFHMEYEGIYGCVINDPLAVAIILDENLMKGFSSYTDIAIDGIARGQSIVDDHNFYKKNSNSMIYTDVDVERFFNILNNVLGDANEKIRIK